jgi:two-component system NtrC family sensor kinase
MADQPTTDYSSIRRRILAAMLIVPGIPCMLALAVGYYYFYNSLKSETMAKIERIADSHRQLVEAFLDERTNDLKLIINSYEYEELARPGQLTRVFENLTQSRSGFMDLSLFNSEGVHVAYVGPYDLAGIVYKQEKWFKEVIQKQEYISDVFLGFRKVPHFIIAVTRTMGEKTWVVRATVDTALFDQTVGNVRIGTTGEAYIVNKDGNLQTIRRSGGLLMEPDEDAPSYLTAHDRIRTFLGTNRAGEKYVYATAWMKDNNWLLVVRQQRADAFRQLALATNLIALVLLVGGFLLAAAARYATDQIVRRLKQMDQDKSLLSRQLVAAERLAEVGQMAAGVAHEINNPLQIIGTEQQLIELTVEEMQEGGELHDSENLAQVLDSLKQINLQIERCANITQGLLKFSRKQEQVVRLISLKDLVSDITNLVRRKAEVEGITIMEDISPALPEVMLDPAELQQVLLNLLNNAIDAISQKGGAMEGQIRITAQNQDGRVRISITDNGCGIKEADQQKIFSPFFTTKPVGQGTGLGLAVSYAIIDKMGGTIEVESLEGLGTTFSIYLPITVTGSRPEETQAPKMKKSTAAPKASGPGGNGHAAN